MLWFLLGYLTGTVLCVVINYRKLIKLYGGKNK